MTITPKSCDGCYHILSPGMPYMSNSSNNVCEECCKKHGYVVNRVAGSEAEQLEQAILAATDNEACEMTKEQREEHLYIVRAWRNAASYADQYGYTVEQFRRGLAAHYGFSMTYGNTKLGGGQ